MDKSMRMEVSSDESDDEIPPTPVFKSTPLVPLKRARKESSSSDNSPNEFKPFVTGSMSRAAERDSSSSEDGSSNLQPSFIRNRLANLKREKISPEQDDSSSEDENNQQVYSEEIKANHHNDSLRTVKPVHPMSSSGSEESDTDATHTTTQLRKQVENSESSDESDSGQKTNRVAVITKTEKPSETDSEDNDDEVANNVGRNQAVEAQTTDDSSENEESKTELQQREDSSSDESEEEGHVVIHKKAPSDSEESNSDNEEPSQPTHSKETSSSDDEPESLQNPVVNQDNILPQSNDLSSSDGETEPSYKSISKNINQPALSNELSSSDEETELNQKPISKEIARPAPSSDESSSEDDLEAAPKSVIQTPMQSKPSEDSSDEEEELFVKTESKNPLTNKNTAKSSENSSSSEEEEATSTSQNLQTYSDSSEELSDHIETAGALINNQQNRNNGIDAVSKSNVLRIVNNHLATTAKKGWSLLDETLHENRPVEVHDTLLTIEGIGNDDEIWLVQCPKSMNIKTLKKQSLNLAANHDIQLEDGPTFKRFSVTSEQSLESAVNCLLPSREAGVFQIASLPVKGKVVIQEHVHVPKLKIPSASVTGPVPFPSGLKVRHPLLGAAFEKHMEEAKVALQKSFSYSKEKKKNKRKEKSNYELSGERGRETPLSKSVEKSLHSTSNTSYKKKRRSKDQSNSGETSNDRSFEIGRPKKSKKSTSLDKYSLNDSSINVNGDQSLLNETIQKKTKKDKDDVKSYNNSEERQKDPKSTWHTPQVNEVSIGSVEDKDVHHSKKSKKSKKEAQNLLIPSEIKREKTYDTINSNELYNHANLDATFLKKRKRKSESHQEDTSNQNCEDSIDSSLRTQKRKKIKI